MDWYWVLYTIPDSTTGDNVGVGTIEIQMVAPSCVADIGRLNDHITGLSHEARTFREGHQAAVSAWSKMGA